MRLAVALCLSFAANVHAIKPDWVCVPNDSGHDWDCRRGAEERTTKPFVAPPKRPLVGQPYVEPIYSPQQPHRLASLSASPWLQTFTPDPAVLAMQQARRPAPVARVFALPHRPQQPPSAIQSSKTHDFVAQDTPPEPRKPAQSSLNDPATALYYIQLSAASTPRALARFIDAHRLDSSKLQVVATSHGAAPWFQLVMGPFAKRAAARAVLAGLKPSLQRSGPWIRHLKASQLETASSLFR